METIAEMDERFKKTIQVHPNDYKPYNKKYVFYVDLTQEGKSIIISNNLNFDLCGRICDHDGNMLIPKDEFYKFIGEIQK